MMSHLSLWKKGRITPELKDPGQNRKTGAMPPFWKKTCMKYRGRKVGLETPSFAGWPLAWPVSEATIIADPITKRCSRSFQQSNRSFCTSSIPNLKQGRARLRFNMRLGRVMSSPSISTGVLLIWQSVRSI